MLFYFTLLLAPQLGFDAIVFNCNLKATQSDIHSLLLDQGLAYCSGAMTAPGGNKGTRTVTEMAILASVRCIVGVNTAVQLYRDESLQPY